jgi:hypothetical protein
MIPSESNSSSGNTVAREYVLSRRDPIRLAIIARINRSMNTRTRRKIGLFGGLILGPSRMANDGAVVETVIFTEAALIPFNATELGETVHVERLGAPAQLRDTVWLKPPPGETEMEYVAVWPAVTVAVGATDAIEKSSPVPLSATVCGLPGPLSLIVNVPVLAPLVVGSKKTPMEQLAPPARLFPQALSVPKSLGLAVTLAMLSGASPLFVTVTV